MFYKKHNVFVRKIYFFVLKQKLFFFVLFLNEVYVWKPIIS